jgi:sec-independent protein translocase protein TatA
MNVGPAEILVILVVALIVFGPKRLPEVGRQVGAAMREVRRMQNTVRAELDTVLHPDVTPPDPSHATPDAIPDAIPGAIEDIDHSTIPAPEPENYDEGFAGPRSFT